MVHVGCNICNRPPLHCRWCVALFGHIRKVLGVTRKEWPCKALCEECHAMRDEWPKFGCASRLIQVAALVLIHGMIVYMQIHEEWHSNITADSIKYIIYIYFT